MKKIFSLGLLLLAAALIFAGPVRAQGQAAKSAALANEAALGKVTVTLAGPEGLTRVDGLDPKVDAYIQSRGAKLKLNVLAVYAVPAEWKTFADQASAGKPAAIPRYAMICVPRKMAKKSFDGPTMRKEHKKYNQWFDLAANNPPVAALLTSQGNSKLKEIMGVDIGFAFRTGGDTKKVAETSSSLTLGARVGFKIYGQPSDVYLTATSLGVGDKMVFLAFFEKYGSSATVAQTQARSLAWRDAMNGLNAAQYQKK